MGKRQESRERTERQILEVGKRHLSSTGAAGLSLRAIARELGMVSSAVYRYVASRDELLTLLLVDAYTDLADEVDAARSAAEPWPDQLAQMGRAARRWAIRQPASWALLYGTPVPGYHAPAELTVGPGTRVVGSMFSVLAAGAAQGALRSSDVEVRQSLSKDFDGLRAEFGFPGDDTAVARCLMLWSGLVGAISMEVFGQYGADTFSDDAEVFELQLALLIETLLDPAPTPN